jgi:integration host factor subunit beta
MNKLELITELGEQQNLSKNEAKKVVDLFFNEVCEALGEGKRVEIRGLCTFKVKEYKGYDGRNPKTGELVKVKPKRLPFFKAGSDLKVRVDR